MKTRTPGRNKINIAGQRFGKLTAIKDSGERSGSGSVKWLCMCDCGREATVIGSALRYGNSKSCGCSRKGKAIKDLTGQKFTRLTVLKDSGKRKHRAVVWNCICDCGEKTKATGNALIFKRIKSCGCIVHETKDLTGQKFGKLTATKRTEEKKGGAYLWNCKCDCGNPKKARSDCLLNGGVKSCGCLFILHNKSFRIFSDEKDYQLTPGVRHSKNLSDSYVRGLLCVHDGQLKAGDITPEMIELKRQHLIMVRTLKQFKEWRKENESNSANV